MKLKHLNNSLLFLLIIMFCSCQSEYTKLVKKELDSGKKNDTIFHNLKFGNTQKEFFEICWELNKRGIATHGGNNQNVKVILNPKDITKTTDKIEMLFYPKFSPKNSIVSMNVIFSFVAWSPWNKELVSETLLPRIQDTLMKWYPGNSFIKVKDNILVKVDGNRQIQLSKKTDKDVSVLIENLSYKYNKLNK